MNFALLKQVRVRSAIIILAALSLFSLMSLLSASYWQVYEEVSQDMDQALSSFDSLLDDALINVKELNQVPISPLCDSIDRRNLVDFFYQHLNSGLFLVRSHDSESPLFCSITGEVEHLSAGKMHEFPLNHAEADLTLFGVQPRQSVHDKVYLFIGYIGDYQVSATRMNLPERFTFFEAELMGLRRAELALSNGLVLSTIGSFKGDGMSNYEKTSNRYPFTVRAVISFERVLHNAPELALQLSPMFIVLWFGAFYLYLLQIQSNAGLTKQLKLGVKRGEFIAFYQPIIDARINKVVGAEALIRWQRADGRLESPALFIDALENSSLIHDVTKQLVMSMPKDLDSILKQDRNFRCSVNIIPDHLEAEDFLNFLGSVAETGYPCSQLALEITERLPLKNLEFVKQSILRAHELGIVVELDDAGTGYGGASYLQELKLDIIKIDKLFVDALLLADNPSPIIDAYVQMAQTLEMQTIAEGVETESQSEVLVNKGIYLHQGFYYSRPLPPHEFIKFYQEFNNRNTPEVDLKRDTQRLVNSTTSVVA